MINIEFDHSSNSFIVRVDGKVFRDVPNLKEASKIAEENTHDIKRENPDKRPEKS